MSRFAEMAEKELVTNAGLPPEERRYVNVRFVARRFGISTSSIWKWARLGTFPKPVKFGSNITRWSVADLDEWEQTQHGEAEQ